MMFERAPGEYVCECPEPVKKLEVRRGKVVATLESGMKFIVPSVVHPKDTIPPQGT